MTPTRLPPELTVEAADGTVRLYTPTPDRHGWAALVAPTDASPVVVVWTPHRGGPTAYLCQVHGPGRSKHLCSHTRAAAAARGIAEKEYGNA